MKLNSGLHIEKDSFSQWTTEDGKWARKWTDTKTGWRLYQKQGMEVPGFSVTTILASMVTKKDVEFYTSQGWAYWNMLKQAAKKGEKMHELMDKHDLGQAISGKKGDYKSMFIECLHARQAWEEDHDIRVEALEMPLISPLGFAGRLDRVMLCDGKREVWDWKTGSSWKYSVKATWQMSVYAKMYEAQTGHKIDALRICHCDIDKGLFNPNARYISSRASIEGCYENFLHLFKAWKGWHYNILKGGNALCIRDPVDYKKIFVWPDELIFN